MDADSSASMTDSDDDPSPGKVAKCHFANAKAKDQVGVEVESSAGAASEIVDENTVYYRIYAMPSVGTSAESIDAGSINLENLATLQAFAYNLSKDYIWHNEPFRLFRKDTLTPHFSGRTDFGENTEDEWFIVYLLYEISKNFPDYIISVIDSDGQFLLIEAADFVPAWLDSDIADNRVFIFRGALHIVPLSKLLKPCPRSLSASNINRLLIADPSRIFAVLQQENLLNQSYSSDNIQRAILKRIDRYPDRLSTQWHRANCVLPAKVVALLSETGPFFLATAVHLSCQKDAKVQSQEFSFDFSSADLLTTSITFSKHLYAKLSSWKEIPNYDDAKWKFPKMSDMGFKANELGMKLTRGLELLCSAAAQERIVNATTNTRDLFVGMLHVLGYFEGAPEGTRRHDQLLKRALLYHQTQTVGTDEKRYLHILGSLLMETVANLDVVSIDRLRSEYPPQEEDDDDWMNITPDKLDDLLSNKWFGEASKANGPLSAVAINGATLANGGHVPGVSVVPKSAAEAKDRPRPGPKGAERGIDTFGESIKRMLDLQIPHDGDDSSDMESYSEEMPDLSLDEKGAITAMNALLQMMGTQKKAGTGSSTKPKTRKSHLKAPAKENARKADHAAKSSHSPGADSINFEDDDFTPVDIDKKLVSNMLDSYFPEACGQSGSTSSLLHGDRELDIRKGSSKKRADK